MQLYQDEYISNISDFIALTGRMKEEFPSFEEYEKKQQQRRHEAEQKIKKNTELLRSGLFPMLNHMSETSEEDLHRLEGFAASLFDGRETLDTGLFCQIHRALLSMARIRKDRNAIIRELYWLGIGLNNISKKLAGLPLPIVEKYIFEMRLCFTEAAAYIKYFDEIEDSETRGYILRSRGNMSLGRFKTHSDKIHMVKQTLQILQDKEYHEKAPELPWDRYIAQTHQQMAASMSHSKENPMTPEDIADVMESVYVVYQDRFQNADFFRMASRRAQFSYYSIEFYCGLDTIQGLLAKLESLMDEAEPMDFSEEGMYVNVSLPAFYCQYLENYPERIPERREYVSELYHRIIDYMNAFPVAEEKGQMALYLRQLSHTFVEVEGGVDYGEYLQKLLKRFTPNIYLHSYVVGKMAVFFCEFIYSEEPTYFDDIEHIGSIEDPGEKRKEILEYAMNCGLFHDVGKIDFLELYSMTARQWFAEEYELAYLHTLAGEVLLSGRPSTRIYAEVALGHHAWYDDVGGYPEKYKRLQCTQRQMVDVISLMNWIENATNTSWLYTGVEKTYDEAIQGAIELEGRRFSPLLTARLQEKNVAEKIFEVMESARNEADYILYSDLLQENRTMGNGGRQ